ncbi:39S ribosomal protein L15, mitochondrial [Cimex lectularius]|uniref:Large ribosomal subunit protein uL15m n=1 Tax=Cimex lectularius TaxID=79782 RepID=A0A8I6SF72_CIMLE|nr:39S ribosomal protein L15, mitochondrial [Cimex lectularius]XP_024080778.1 39S ribosomal protein L15, mitochondrial [Cimex lectularius]
MGSVKNTSEKALAMLRALPRISLSNLRNTGQPYRHGRGRAQHGGDKHGCGNKGSGQRQNFMRLGYETGNNPFYIRFPYEPYYKGHHTRKQYPPLSLLQLQKMIDTNRIDTTVPIDLATIVNTGLYRFQPEEKHYGVNLTDEGADVFKAKINIEVQWASEGTIAAIEKNGGVITTAYYDVNSLWVLKNVEKFFKNGQPLPRRMIPTEDVILYYSSAENRGYLADPEKVAYQRVVLAQKYGYKLPAIDKNDPLYETLMERKDPRQILYGLAPGWIVNLVNKEILKPKDPSLEEYYKS